jgi:hypothetical protein
MSTRSSTSSNNDKKEKRKSATLFGSVLESEILPSLDFDNEDFKIFDTSKDSIFVDDNQTVLSNFSDIIKALTPKKTTQFKVQPGSYIIEVTNRNFSGVYLTLSISTLEDTFSKKKYTLAPLHLLQKKFDLETEKTFEIQIHPDLNYEIDYSGYIYKNIET